MRLPLIRRVDPSVHRRNCPFLRLHPGPGGRQHRHPVDLRLPPAVLHASVRPEQTEQELDPKTAAGVGKGLLLVSHHFRHCGGMLRHLYGHEEYC